MKSAASRAHARSAPVAREHARQLLRALALAAIALPGALPGSRGAPDPVAFLTWLAFCAAPVGALAGGLRVPAWPHAAAIPGTWMFALVAVDALAPRDLPTPLWAGLAATGLFAVGHAIGRSLSAARAHATAAALLAVCALLVLAPVAGLALRAPWPGDATGILLDASPATLLAEYAGVDWLRHPAIYDAAGSADVDPRSRSPYSPTLAAGIVLVLGCALALCAERAARARERKSDVALP